MIHDRDERTGQKGLSKTLSLQRSSKMSEDSLSFRVDLVRRLILDWLVPDLFCRLLRVI